MSAGWRERDFSCGVAHLSLVVASVERAGEFYEEILEARLTFKRHEFREYSVFGHQLVLRTGNSGLWSARSAHAYGLDGEVHWGVVVSDSDVAMVASRLRRNHDPAIDIIDRHAGTSRQHRCVFFRDLDGYVWEVKAYTAAP